MAEKIIKTAARIDAVNAPKLDTFLQESICAGEIELGIDMADTIYISSIGLRALAAALKKLRGLGGTMIIRNVKPQIMEIFEVTGFAGIFSIE